MKLINIIFSEIFRPFINKKPVLLPEKYRGLTLVKDLKHGKKTPYAVGIYKNSRGQKYVGKFWTGSFKDVYYYLLSHEISVLKTLNSIEDKHHKILNKYPVYFSKIFYSRQDNSSIAVLSKFNPGTTLLELTPSQQLKYHQAARNYLKDVGNLATSAQKKAISLKSLSIFIYQFPLLLLASTVRQPWLIKYLFINIFTFFRCLPILYKNSKNLVLTHGDLHGKNILIHNKKAMILDVEQTVYTYPDYELINCMSSPYFAKNLKKELLKKIKSQARNSHSDYLRIKGLLVNYSIHCLTGELNSNQVSRYKTLLEYGIYLK